MPWGTSSSLKQSTSIGKGTVRLDDFELADAIFVFGQNPRTTPRMLHSLHHAADYGVEDYLAAIAATFWQQIAGLRAQIYAKL
ncbi:hypothetical protein [Sodalis sp.]|uniref:hypothetical protein n=1 Tax=Sodalis sp. (in: enterobacteria) TaxID=1898979 RepID=UPI003872AFEE